MGAGSFASPIDISAGGLSLDPGGNTFWIGSSQTNSVVEVQPDGTLVRTIDLSGQGISSEITGLAFDNAGNLLASSTLGVVYQLDLDPPPTPDPVLTSITVLAEDGTAADAGLASANAGQTIDLVGANLTRQMEVLFPTRDNSGNHGTVAVNPTGVNDDGTLAQVSVPNLAQTELDSITVVGGSGSVPLQIVPVITGISGRPGRDGTFDLTGSGFMEGASTITIGGVVIEDRYTNDASNRLLDGDVTGNRNSNYRLISSHSVEGPIRVETAGGFSELAGPSFTAPSFVEFTGLDATASLGTPADGGDSANTSQSITLLGRGFTNNTLVQFAAMDDTGTAGTLTRHRYG